MQVGTDKPRTAHGSFGIPPALKEEHERIIKEREKKMTGSTKNQEEDISKAPPPYVEEGFSFGGEKKEEADQTEESSSQENQEREEAPADDMRKTKDGIFALIHLNKIKPEEALRLLGMELLPDDYAKIFCNGFIEKSIQLFQTLDKKFTFGATIRTLKADEYEIVDEMLAEEINNVKMTNDGLIARRSSLIMAFGITKLMGRAVCEIVRDKAGKIDIKKTVKAKRAVIGQMQPSVVDELMRYHGALTICLKQIVSQPDGTIAKK
jgi:hypothetical protein